MPHPFWPIIYVRGYAMTQGEIEDTTADPFCGFNLGSTVYRASADRRKVPRKFIFESPVLRLGKDFDYQDVYRNGLDIGDPGWEEGIPERSIIVYRYYDPASQLLGTDRKPDIAEFARGLSDLILQVRDRVCQSKPKLKPKAFRCYLVAHSMGGLVCRAFLQNKALGSDKARACVDKFFTYATPHNGIEMAGINVPEWLTLFGMNTFNREQMATYLDLKAVFKKTGRVDWMPESVLPPDRVFCMIGSNRGDYEVAYGGSRTFAGHGSDGLVRIDHATLSALDAAGEPSGQACARAVAYRAHSGHFGIVNSEEAYQNLIRFLFGDTRLDAWLEISSVSLPDAVQAKVAAGKVVEAVYQVEALASVKGKPWSLTRRVAEEDSVICRTHQEITSGTARPLQLANVFLGTQWENPQKDASRAYALQVGIRVPDYEIDHALWFDEHYEGSYLFRDTALFQLVPDASAPGGFTVLYDWQSRNPGAPATPLVPTVEGSTMAYLLPIEAPGHPGIKGQLRLIASSWNGS